MENKTDLIERLRKIANELENDLKPKYEAGKYHWTSVNSLYYIESINGDKCYGYGVDHSNNWKTGFVCYVENIRCVATESEVKEALTKEAVKRSLVERGVKFKDVFDGKIEIIDGLRLNYCEKENTLHVNCDCIFNNGIWATVIKERSLEEWIKDCCKQSKQLIDYMKQTKTELIEILNNLPND